MATEREKAIEQWTAVQGALANAYMSAHKINGEAGDSASRLLASVSEAVAVWMDKDLADLERSEEAASADEATVHELAVKQCCKGGAESKPNPALNEFRKRSADADQT